MVSLPRNPLGGARLIRCVPALYDSLNYGGRHDQAVVAQGRHGRCSANFEASLPLMRRNFFSASNSPVAIKRSG